jgi:redox-sensing transcriptional repressor
LAKIPVVPAIPIAKKAPLPVLRRLSIYHQILTEMKERQVEMTSSTVISNAVEYKPIQVRKDLQILGLVGKPKIGFHVDELLDAIKRYVGWSREHRAILIGVGNLGSALLNFPWLAEYGLRFIAAFDASEKRSNIVVNHIPIHPISYFPKYVRTHNVDIAVIAVPITAAQDVTDMVVAAGVRGVWNFSATPLKVPSHVIVENALFTQSLAVLTRRLSEGKITK